MNPLRVIDDSDEDDQFAMCDWCFTMVKEGALLVSDINNHVCSDCLVHVQAVLVAYQDALPGPSQAAMATMAQLCRAAAVALERKPWCPWCHSLDVDAEFVDIGVDMQQVTPYCCGQCGAGQFMPGVTKEDVDAEEWRFGWFGPQGMEP